MSSPVPEEELRERFLSLPFDLEEGRRVDDYGDGYGEKRPSSRLIFNAMLGGKWHAVVGGRNIDQVPLKVEFSNMPPMLSGTSEAYLWYAQACERGEYPATVESGGLVFFNIPQPAFELIARNVDAPHRIGFLEVNARAHVDQAGSPFASTYQDHLDVHFVDAEKPEGHPIELKRVSFRDQLRDERPADLDEADPPATDDRLMLVAAAQLDATRELLRWTKLLVLSAISAATISLLLLVLLISRSGL